MLELSLGQNKQYSAMSICNTCTIYHCKRIYTAVTELLLQMTNNHTSIILSNAGIFFSLLTSLINLVCDPCTCKQS